MSGRASNIDLDSRGRPIRLTDRLLSAAEPLRTVLRVEVGYGLEGVLTDAAASTIVQSLVLPRFRAGDLPGGVEAIETGQDHGQGRRVGRGEGVARQGW